MRSTGRGLRSSLLGRRIHSAGGVGLPAGFTRERVSQMVQWVYDQSGDGWAVPSHLTPEEFILAEAAKLKGARTLYLHPPEPLMPWVYDDGGRAAAGFKGDAGDCALRAVVIALELPYRETYYQTMDRIRDLAQTSRKRVKSTSPRDGVPVKVTQRFLLDAGWVWVPTMAIGSGCTVHLRPDELPAGRIVVRLSKHLAAVIDGVLHDTYDCSRNGSRCVYGYWQKGVKK